MTWSQIVAGFQKPITPLSEEAKERTHKRCLGCEKMLPLDNFYTRGEKNRLVGRCKPCYKEQQKQFNRRAK